MSSQKSACFICIFCFSLCLWSWSKRFPETQKYPLFIVPSFTPLPPAQVCPPWKSQWQPLFCATFVSAHSEAHSEDTHKMARNVRPPLHRITQIDSSSTERVFQNQKSPAPHSWCSWCVVYCKTLRLPLRSVNRVEGMFATLTQHPAAPLSLPPNSDVICQSMISRFFFLFFFRLGESKGVSHVTVSHVTHFLACVMMLYHVYFCRVCVLWVHNESSLGLSLCAIRKVGCVFHHSPALSYS